MIGILAYGSLINDPGIEIKPAVEDKIINVRTPFQIEFARKSDTRDGAPTLIPVATGGDSINAQILILKDTISESDATDMVWRRETRQEGSRKNYTPSSSPGPNTVLVKKVTNFEGLEVVLYTKIGSNIDILTPKRLAKLAISSAKSDAGMDKKDGISYLINAKQNNIETPLMHDWKFYVLQTQNRLMKHTKRLSINSYYRTSHHIDTKFMLF